MDGEPGGLFAWHPGVIDGPRLVERLARRHGRHGDLAHQADTARLALAVAALVNRWAEAFPPERLLEERLLDVEFALTEVKAELEAVWLAGRGRGR
jgi:hypothetical protein